MSSAFKNSNVTLVRYALIECSHLFAVCCPNFGLFEQRIPTVRSSVDPDHDNLMIRSTFIVLTRIYTNFCLNEASLEEMPIFLLGFGIEWPGELECGWVPEWTMHFLQWPSVVPNLDSGTWHTVSKCRFISIIFELFSILYCIISYKIIRKKKEFEAI